MTKTARNNTYSTAVGCSGQRTALGVFSAVQRPNAMFPVAGKSESGTHGGSFGGGDSPPAVRAGPRLSNGFFAGLSLGEACA